MVKRSGASEEFKEDVTRALHSQRATQYTFSLLPEEHDAWATFAITVEYRGAKRWAVKRGPYSLTRGEKWGLAPRASDARPRQLAHYRFGLTEACELAEKMLPTVTVAGWTAAEVLARGDAGNPEP